jgi:hypothetical protein
MVAHSPPKAEVVGSSPIAIVQFSFCWVELDESHHHPDMIDWFVAGGYFSSFLFFLFDPFLRVSCAMNISYVLYLKAETAPEAYGKV